MDGAIRINRPLTRIGSSCLCMPAHCGNDHGGDCTRPKPGFDTKTRDSQQKLELIHNSSIPSPCASVWHCCHRLGADISSGVCANQNLEAACPSGACFP